MSYDEDRALLLASDGCDVDEDRDGQLYVMLGDTFAWACADGEDIPDDKVSEVATLFRRWGWAGLLYWASKQRGHAQTAFKDNNRFLAFVRREEEWREQEPSSTKRGYMEIPERKSAPDSAQEKP